MVLIDYWLPSSEPNYLDNFFHFDCFKSSSGWLTLVPWELVCVSVGTRLWDSIVGLRVCVFLSLRVCAFVSLCVCAFVCLCVCEFVRSCVHLCVCTFVQALKWQLLQQLWPIFETLWLRKSWSWMTSNWTRFQII